MEVLSRVVTDAAAQYRLVVAEKELLNKTLNGSIKLLTDILSMVDTKAFKHSEKLRVLISELAPKMSMAGSWEMHLAAMLSPIGYVTLPPETLVKARAGEALSKTEQQLINNAPETAARLLGNIPRLEEVAKIVRYQQKHFDGTGFPADDIKCEAIPSAARLLKILNDMLELQAQGKSQAEAMNELAMRRGLYDPQLIYSMRTALEVDDENPEALQTVLMSVNDLAPGMILHTDVLTKDGILILSAGHHINEMVLEKIHNFNSIYGIQEPIYVKSPNQSRCI
jgi:response regulator RpfG family c-di-GMP phosphodiesterase